jgi:hypothetical protein
MLTFTLRHRPSRKPACRKPFHRLQPSNWNNNGTSTSGSQPTAAGALTTSILDNTIPANPTLRFYRVFPQ